MFYLESSPPVELSSLSELHATLDAGGVIAFRVPEKKRRGFKAQIDRINTSEKLARRRHLLSRVAYYCYMFYLAVRGNILSFGCKPLEHALLVYSTSWRHIETYRGENLDGDHILVTFVGKKLTLEAD